MANALEKVGAVGVVGCIIAVVAIPLCVIDITLMGFVTMKIWNWFLPGLGVGIPTLTFGQAVGIRVVWACFHRNTPKIKNGEEPTGKQQGEFFVNVLLWLLLSPAILLFLGYVVKTII